MRQRNWALKRKRRCGENFNTVGGMDDGSSDDGGMGGSSSFSASASGLPNGNHQRHCRHDKPTILGSKYRATRYGPPSGKSWRRGRIMTGDHVAGCPLLPTCWGIPAPGLDLHGSVDAGMQAVPRVIG
jgi:hypothetical protein